jgi:hypothetical protein
MIDNIQDFAGYFGATTPTELSQALWKHDSYVSSATFTTASGETFTTYPDFYSLDDFPQGVVSVVFDAIKEGCDYEPTMTPLVFPFPEEDIDEAIEYLDDELTAVDDWGEGFVEDYFVSHSTSTNDKWKVT